MFLNFMSDASNRASYILPIPVLTFITSTRCLGYWLTASWTKIILPMCFFNTDFMEMV